MKKILLSLGILCFSILFSINVKASTPKQIEESSLTSENIDTRASTLDQINASNTSSWSSYGFTKLAGDNLSKDYYVTTDTTKLVFSRNYTKKHRYSLTLEDSKGSSLGHVEIGFGATSGTINVFQDKLKVGEQYHVYTSERDIWGRITGLGNISYFTVHTGVEAHKPPIINAESRTVFLNDPNFDIKENISAFDDEGNDITKSIKISGKVDISSEGVYPVVLSVTDKNGLTTEKEIKITVLPYNTEISSPTLDVVTDNDYKVTGRGTPGNIVYVILGTEVYRETINIKGDFSINLEKTYPVGTGITAHAEDLSGNKSENVYAVVQAGRVTIGVNKIVSSDVFVTGHTVPNAQVEVTVNNSKAHVFYGISDILGNYQVSMNGNRYPAGTSIEAVAKLNGQSSLPVSVIVYPKKITINTVSVGDKIISGQGDPYAKIHLSISGTNYEFMADAAGNFSGEILPVKEGERVIAYQTSNEIDSEAIELVVNYGIDSKTLEIS